MVNFYIASVDILQFRGIQNLSLELDNDSPAVLIGPNNAGKSTILDALGLCLTSPRFSRYVPDERDFWQDAAGHVADTFTITVYFATRDGGRLPAVKPGVGDPIEVHGIRAVGSLAEGSTTRYLIDDEGKNILLNLGAPISKAKKEQFKGMGLGGRRFAKPLDIAKFMPKVFQFDTQSLSPSLYDWQSGPLQRLMRLYREKLFTEHWTVDGTRTMPDQLTKLHKYVNDNLLQTPFWKDVLSKELAAKFTSYLGTNSGFFMRPQLNDLEQWLASELMLRVAPASTLAAVDARRLGSGWQSLIRLAALEVLIQIEDVNVFLLMEEPETFLHPHLRRRMRRVLDALQRSGSQSVVTTHSSELISFTLQQDIVRLSMTDSGVQKHRYQSAHASAAMKDEEKLHEHGNHEVVFANRVVLTEGKSDESAVRLGLEKAGLDCDAEGISIVGCGGIDNLPDYCRLCSTLGIPWIAIHDRDASSGVQNPNTAKVAAELANLKSAADDVTTWDNTLEEVLSCPHSKAEPKWILATLGARAWPAIASDPALSNYSATIQHAVAFLTK